MAVFACLLYVMPPRPPPPPKKKKKNALSLLCGGWVGSYIKPSKQWRIHISICKSCSFACCPNLLVICLSKGSERAEKPCASWDDIQHHPSQLVPNFSFTSQASVAVSCVAKALLGMHETGSIIDQRR